MGHLVQLLMYAVRVSLALPPELTALLLICSHISFKLDTHYTVFPKLLSGQHPRDHGSSHNRKRLIIQSFNRRSPPSLPSVFVFSPASRNTWWEPWSLRSVLGDKRFLPENPFLFSARSLWSFHLPLTGESLYCLGECCPVILAVGWCAEAPACLLQGSGGEDWSTDHYSGGRGELCHVLCSAQEGAAILGQIHLYYFIISIDIILWSFHKGQFLFYFL